MSEGKADRSTTAAGYLELENAPILRLYGRMDHHSGASVDVDAVIFQPFENAGHSDWSCTIRCPAIFSSDVTVAGVDRKQALELAKMLLFDLLNHHHVRVERTETVS